MACADERSWTTEERRIGGDELHEVDADRTALRPQGHLKFIQDTMGNHSGVLYGIFDVIYPEFICFLGEAWLPRM